MFPQTGLAPVMLYLVLALRFSPTRSAMLRRGLGNISRAHLVCGPICNPIYDLIRDQSYDIDRATVLFLSPCPYPP